MRFSGSRRWKLEYDQVLEFGTGGTGLLRAALRYGLTGCARETGGEAATLRIPAAMDWVDVNICFGFT